MKIVYLVFGLCVLTVNVHSAENICKEKYCNTSFIIVQSSSKKAVEKGNIIFTLVPFLEHKNRKITGLATVYKSLVQEKNGIAIKNTSENTTFKKYYKNYQRRFKKINKRVDKYKNMLKAHKNRINVIIDIYPTIVKKISEKNQALLSVDKMIKINKSSTSLQKKKKTLMEDLNKLSQKRTSMLSKISFEKNISIELYTKLEKVLITYQKNVSNLVKQNTKSLEREIKKSKKKIFVTANRSGNLMLNDIHPVGTVLPYAKIDTIYKIVGEQNVSN